MKNGKTKIIGKLAATLCVVIAIFAAGYFSLDKLIIPKYFGQYGINSLPNLVGVVTSLYSSPKESKFVTNGYTQNDLTNAIDLLQDSNYKIEDNGTIIKDNMASFKGEGELFLTDREFAAICNQLIKNGMLDEALPNLNYLNVMNISILEVIITPNEESIDSDGKFNAAEISFIAKIETDDIREQIALQMETPKFLLNMIIPDVLYFEVSYDFDLTKTESERVSNGSISINGRTSKQSQILIDLLIDFIFPEEDNMDIEKFTAEVGKISLEGVDALGDFKFASGLGSTSTQNGIFIYA